MKYDKLNNCCLILVRHVHSWHRHMSTTHWIGNGGVVHAWIPDQFPHLVCLELPQVHQFAAVHETLQEDVYCNIFVQELSNDFL